PTLDGPLINQFSNRDIFHRDATGFEERDLGCILPAGLESRHDISQFDEIFPMAASTFDDAQELTGLDLGLLDRVNHKSVRSHDDFIIDLTSKQEISTGGIHMHAGN